MKPQRISVRETKFARKEYLKQYLRACLRDSVLSLEDIVSLAAVEKVVATISGDAKAALADLASEFARENGGKLLHKVSKALGGIAEDVVAGRRQR